VSAIGSKLSPKRQHESRYDLFPTFNTRNNILSELSFLNPSGIEQITSSNLSLYAKETLTGLKLVVVVHPDFPPDAARGILAIAYTNYADFVLKDPFYATDMPIRCTLFDKAIRQILQVGT
jgi:hypothetical protein